MEVPSGARCIRASAVSPSLTVSLWMPFSLACANEPSARLYSAVEAREVQSPRVRCIEKPSVMGLRSVDDLLERPAPNHEVDIHESAMYMAVQSPVHRHFAAASYPAWHGKVWWAQKKFVLDLNEPNFSMPLMPTTHL